MAGKSSGPAANLPVPTLNDLLPGVPSLTVDGLLRKLGFPDAGSAELNLVLPHLQRGFHALRQCAAGMLPDTAESLADELEQVLSTYSEGQLALIARGSSSRMAADPNPLRGSYDEYPLRAVVSIRPEQIPRKDADRFHTGLGILLLSRLAPGAPDAATELEREVAADLRKCFTKQSWKPARALFPAVGEQFFHTLRAWKTSPAAAFLPASQRDFFRSLAQLLSSRHFRVVARPSRVRPINDDEDSEISTPGAKLGLDQTELPGRQPEPTDDVEPDDLPAGLLQIDPSTRKAGQGEDLERRRLIDAAHRFVRDNQFISYRWHSLTPEEVWEVARLATELLQRPGTRKIATVGAFVLLTAHDPEDLADFVVAQDLAVENDDTFWTGNFLDLTTGYWWHRGPRVPNQFRPAPEQRVFLQKHAHWLGLALPNVLWDSLRSYGSGPTQSLAELLVLGEGQFETALSEFCAMVRHLSPWVRAFPARLRSHAFDWWTAHTSDDTMASLASAVTEYAPSPPLYYYAVCAGELQALHLQRLAELGWIPATPAANLTGRFGSQLQPTRTAIGALIEHLIADIAVARQAYMEGPGPETIAELHNAMALYTMTMLIFGTGHRLAVEYCFSRETLALDDHLVVLADKIISAANAARLVALPEICAAQVRAYFEHLNLVAARVSRYVPAMAVRIRSLVGRDPQGSKLPLFGLLSSDLTLWKELSIETLKNLLGDVWPIPLNAPRDTLASETREAGLSAEFNHYRAGHIGLGQNPWSHWSPLIPAQVMDETARAADSLLSAHGWKVETGMEGRVRNPLRLELGSQAQAEPPHKVGPLERARAATSPQTLALVNKVRTEAMKGQSNPKFSDEDVAAMQQSILQHAAGDAITAATALNRLTGWLRRHEALKRSAILPGLALPMTDPPVFGPDTALEIAKAKEFREAILEYLARHRQPDQSEALSRISVCAIAFGGIVRPVWIMPTLQACADAYTADGRVWMEIRRKFDDHGDLLEFVRRPLDPLTTCLVLRYRRAGLLTTEALHDTARVRRDIDRLFQRIRDGAGIWNLPGNAAEACRMMRPFFRFVLPGMLAGIGDGRAQGYCLSRSDFLRVVGGLDTVPPPALESPAPNSSAKPVNVAHHSGYTLNQAKALLGAVNEILMTALSPTAVGGKHGSQYQTKWANAIVAIDALPIPATSPSVVTLLLKWVRLLFDDGGRSGRRLQPSSIRTYWHRIAVPLLEFAFNRNLAELDDEDFEELYSLVLDARAKRSRPQRARVLRDFHQRCGINLPDVDWYEIEPHIDLDRQRVDAQVVMPKEYGAALTQLSVHETTRPDYARALGCSTILQYRGGLRLGDVLRLTLSDVRVTPAEILVFVRRNRFGRPKTPAGRRIVRLAAPLLRAEERLKLEQLIEYRKRQCGDDMDAALFGPSSDGGELYDRRAFERDICELLRWVTGRPDARSHHLRHSAGSYQMAAAIPPERDSGVWQQVCDYFGSDEPDKAILRYYLNDERPSRRIVHAISVQIGHASPDSTFSYIHFHEVALARWLWDSAPARIDQVDSTIRIIREDPDHKSPKSTWRGSAYDLAESLSGITNTDLRQLKTGGTDVGCLRELASLMIKRYPLDHGVAIREESKQPYAPAWATSGLRLENIHLALAGLAEGLAPDVIAQRSGLPAAASEVLIKAARRNVRACSYRAYLQETKGDSATSSIPPIPSDAKGHDLYEKFSKLVADLSDGRICDGLDAWARCYRASRPGIAVETSEDLDSILDFVRLLGIPGDRLRISIPESWTPDQRTELRELLGELGYSSVARDFHRASENKTKSDLATIYVLQASATGTGTRSRDMGAFHQYAYLSWLAAIARPSDRKTIGDQSK